MKLSFGPYKPWLKIVLLIALLADICFSAFQYNGLHLEGDVANVVVPSDDYSAVFKDPLGIMAAQEPYPGPGRFTAFWTMRTVMGPLPILLQNFVPPIESIYLSVTLVKVLVHTLLLLIIMRLAGAWPWSNLGTAFMALYVGSMFQTHGYRDSMGMIDFSITYVFFYALPVAALLLFAKSLLDFIGSGDIPSWFQMVLGFLIAMILVFASPVNGPALSIFVLVALLYVLRTNWDRLHNSHRPLEKLLNAMALIPVKYFVFGALVVAGALYNVYVSSFNVESNWATLPLDQRYERLPKGVYQIFFGTHGNAHFIITLMVLCIMACLIHRTSSGPFKKLLIFLGIGALIYTVLMPLGGYRSYRPLIIRWDSYLPVWIPLIILFLLAFYRIWLRGTNLQRLFAVVLTLALATHLHYMDRFSPRVNECEIRQLNTLQASDPGDQPILLSSECTVLGWIINPVPEYSRFNARLLHQWNVTSEPILYYQVNKEN